MTGTQKPLEILVVEDTYEYALVANETLTSKGHKVSNAYDLESAFFELDRKPNIVLTDMCFHERGVSAHPFEREGEELLVYHGPHTNKKYSITKDSIYSQTLNKGGMEQEGSEISYLAKDSIYKIKELKDIVVQEKLIPILILSTWRRFSRNKKEEEDFKENLLEGLEYKPPMGYYVIKECKKRELPIVIISDIAHGEHILPILDNLKIGRLKELGEIYHKIENLRQEPDVSYFKELILSYKLKPETWLTALNLALEQTK